MTSDNSVLAAYFDRCAAEGVMDSFAEDEVPRIGSLLDRWNLRPGERVVEPGCGAGRLTERLAAAVGSGGRVFAFDISRGMIEKARQRGLPDNVRFEVAEATALPLEDAGFDAAICFHVFPHFSDPPRALAELARVLRPAGRLWVNHLKGRDELNAFHRTVGPEVAGHELPEEARMVELLAGAGFEVVSVEDGRAGYSLHAVRSGHAPSA